MITARTAAKIVRGRNASSSCRDFPNDSQTVWKPTFQRDRGPNDIRIVVRVTGGMLMPFPVNRCGGRYGSRFKIPTPKEPSAGFRDWCCDSATQMDPPG